MVLEVLDASFRYSMDYNFYMQNFSTISYQQLVKPAHESTLMYSFIPADTFAGRPFGFTVNLHYRDAVSSSSFCTKFDAEITVFDCLIFLLLFQIFHRLATCTVKLSTMKLSMLLKLKKD